MRNIAFTFILLFSINCYCQVGIGTTNPKAQLDIKATNASNPANIDGVLVPRIDVFPTVNPTSDQNSMLVYLTTTNTIYKSGYYYWDNPSTTWKNFESKDFNTFDQFSQRPTNLGAVDSGIKYLYTQTGNFHQWIWNAVTFSGKWIVLNQSEINVKDFGAIGDGIADDTVAIQNCLNQYNCIYFPKGIFGISASIIIKDGVRSISGQARDASVIKFLQNATPSLLNINGENTIPLFISQAAIEGFLFTGDKFVIRDLSFDCSGISSSSCLVIQNWDSIIEKCFFSKFTKFGLMLNKFNNNSNSQVNGKISQCFFEGQTAIYGIYFKGSSTDWMIMYNHFSGSNYDVYIPDSAGLIFTNNHTYGIRSAYFGKFYNTVIANNYFETKVELHGISNDSGILGTFGPGNTLFEDLNIYFDGGRSAANGDEMFFSTNNTYNLSAALIHRFSDDSKILFSQNDRFNAVDSFKKGSPISETTYYPLTQPGKIKILNSVVNGNPINQTY